MLDPELERRNMRLGWGLFGLFVVLFLGAFAVALVYLQFD
jgi:ABC-type transporter Mla subunit MlaD